MISLKVSCIKEILKQPDVTYEELSELSKEINQQLDDKRKKWLTDLKKLCDQLQISDSIKVIEIRRYYTNNTLRIMINMYDIYVEALSREYFRLDVLQIRHTDALMSVSKLTLCELVALCDKDKRISCILSIIPLIEKVLQNYDIIKNISGQCIWGGTRTYLRLIK